MPLFEPRDYLADTFRVDASGSAIENVTDDAWRSLRAVDRIDLSGNRLAALPLSLIHISEPTRPY